MEFALAQRFKQRHPFVWIAVAGFLFVIDNAARWQFVTDVYHNVKDAGWPSHLLSWLGLVCLVIGLVSLFLPKKDAAVEAKNVTAEPLTDKAEAHKQPASSSGSALLPIADQDPRIYLAAIRVEEHLSGLETFFAVQNRGGSVAHDVHIQPVTVGYRKLIFVSVDNVAVDQIVEIRPYIDKAESNKYDIISLLQEECEAKARAERTMLDRAFPFTLEIRYRTFGRERMFTSTVNVQYLVWKRGLPNVKLNELFQFQHWDFKRQK